MPSGGKREGAGKPHKAPDANGHSSPYFPSMKAAAKTLGIDIAILRDARAKDCPAFRTGSFIHRQQLADWLAKDKAESDIVNETADEEFVEDYSPPEESGGVGQTLKSLQADERRLKWRLDEIEKSTKFHVTVKAELVKEARRSWLSVSKTLLQYDIKVSMAKRESGELIPLADATKGIDALLAWHTIAVSDALRNVIPEMEGKNKFDMAALLDPALRSSIYRTFKMGVKFGKIPDWMGKAATEFVAGEPTFTLEAPKGPSTNLDDY